MLSVLRDSPSEALVDSRAGVTSLEGACDGGDHVSRAQTALCISFSRKKKKNGVGSGAAKKWEENQASASNPVTSEAPTPPSAVGTAARKERRVMKWGGGSVGGSCGLARKSKRPPHGPVPRSLKGVEE